MNRYNLDIKPELIDRSHFCSMPYRLKEQSRVYVPLDLNKEVIEFVKEFTEILGKIP